jgi:hypothetical protein
MGLLLFSAWICVLEDMLYVMHVCDSCNVIMCSVACMNYCQFHRSLYGSSNYVLFVLNSLEMHYIYVYVCVCVCVCVCVPGMPQIGIRAKSDVL